MNTLLLIVAIIAIIVLYPFYMHIVAIFKATAWMTVIEGKLRKLKKSEKSEKNEQTKNQ